MYKAHWIAAVALAATAFVDVPRGHAQSPATHETFEAASIKLNKVGGEGCSSTNSGGQTYLAKNCPLGGLIMSAYGVSQQRISGPAGQSSYLADKYDITARAEHPVTRTRMQMMLQSLLEDRFNLKIHREMKETPVYALVVGKGGPQFQQSQAGADEGPKSVKGSGGQILAQNLSMSDFLAFLSRRITDRIVEDRTGLKGRYDIEMTRLLELGRPDDPDAPSVFTVIQELGLKLEPQKLPVEHLVIDHVEKPSEN